jgi:hypothetical protein
MSKKPPMVMVPPATTLPPALEPPPELVVFATPLPLPCEPETFPWPISATVPEAGSMKARTAITPNTQATTSEVAVKATAMRSRIPGAVTIEISRNAVGWREYIGS